MKPFVRISLVVAFVWLSAQVLEAKTVRIATFNIQNGPGAPGTTDYEATKAIVQRINADVVGFQELLGTNESNWRQIASELGYAHATFGTNGTSMSGTQRLGYFSRFPISGTNDITSTNELTRRPLRVVVDVPGAVKPLVVWNMHHKANEPDAADLAVTNRNNQLRRAIEARRIVEDINAYRAANPAHDEFVMLGDLNDDIFQTNNQAVEITQSEFDAFRTNSELIPGSHALRSDVTFPVRYRAFPDDHYGPAGGGMHRLDLRQQDATSRETLGSGTLDYIFVSTALRDSPLGAPIGEIYNSQLEATHAGLPKAGAALASSTSRDASDHLAVFADIEMADGDPATFVTSFSPAAGAPGATVTINGLFLGKADSVRFGGVEATDFDVESEAQIRAIVPPGAVTGPITVSGPQGESSSAASFLITVLPTIASALPSPSSLTNFSTVAGSASAAQSFTVSAAGLGGPLQVFAPTGFEVSLDGTNFSDGVAISAPPRSDAATNYAGSWTNGSTGGNGFGAWEMYVSPSNGQAEAYLGSPASSGVQGMAPAAFALRAGPQNSGANVYVWRSLQHPLAVGEAISFDWGINWDSDNTNNGGKGFIIASGSAGIIYIGQRGFPGPIQIWHNNTVADTKLGYGTTAMRWSFRQINATNLNVTATARTNSATIALSTNIPVPGAVNSFWWYADRMDTNANRISYYDNLNIAPIAPGGGAIAQINILVRLAANAPVGAASGLLAISSAGQSLASVALSGTVTGATNAYDAWTQSHGLDPQSIGARGADADSDGHSNLHEFLFGGVPTQATTSLWRHEMQPSGLVLTFVGRGSGASYRLVSTGNLAAGAWTEEAVAITETQDQNGVPEGYKRRRVIVPNPTGNRFFRLQVVESSP